MCLEGGREGGREGCEGGMLLWSWIEPGKGRQAGEGNIKAVTMCRGGRREGGREGGREGKREDSYR